MCNSGVRGIIPAVLFPPVITRFELFRVTASKCRSVISNQSSAPLELFGRQLQWPVDDTMKVMSSMSQTEDVLEELAGLPTLAHPTVSPDGNKIAMYYDITGRNELHVLDIESGERKQWSDGEVPRNARWFVKWGADGDWVYFHFDKDGNEQNDVYRISPRG